MAQPVVTQAIIVSRILPLSTHVDTKKSLKSKCRNLGDWMSVRLMFGISGDL